MRWAVITHLRLLLRVQNKRFSLTALLSLFWLVMSVKLGLLLRVIPLKDVRIHHTEDMVASDDVPSQALRSGKNSSMRLAIDMVKDGTADAVVSAGNSGALMIMALMVLRTIEGIDRPALAAFFPTMNGRCCMLDLGANIECSATNLVQFAVMGDTFFRVTADAATHHSYKPSIGLLNVGEEEQKGSASIRDAAAILSDPEISMNYYGFVEGSDFPMGCVDIVVSDGFSGNVALKTAEGTSRLIGTMIRQAFQSTLFFHDLAICWPVGHSRNFVI